MTWTKVANVAMYGANWTSSYVQTVSRSSPEQGRRIALRNPAISFFFYCSKPGKLMDPSWASPKIFNAGDVVFFTGQPTHCRASQFTSYQKNGMSVAYVGQDNTSALKTAGCYTKADGSPAVDVVCIFAANINQKLPAGYFQLAPNVTVPNGGSIACASAGMLALLRSSAIKELQNKGITVLLTFLNNHDYAGWSEFTTVEDAQRFVSQLCHVVTTYGLDGIDIDDEYSEGTKSNTSTATATSTRTVSNTSLAMVTSLMRRAMPGKIISKALFNDLEDFRVPYQGVTLGQSLTYGWEMTYWRRPQDRLQRYVNAGMAKNALSLGYCSGKRSTNVTADVAWLKANGYQGVMVYEFERAANRALLGKLVEAWDVWDGTSSRTVHEGCA